jgi:hypothetical protein
MSDEIEIIIERNAKGQFLTGHKQVSPGRPKGSRNKLSEDFITAFASDFAVHGVKIVEDVRLRSPEIYLRLCSDLLPRQTGETLAGAGEASIFRACESVSEIIEMLVADVGLAEALDWCDFLRGELLKHASEQALPVE